jgi:hypothetical protein
MNKYELSIQLQNQKLFLLGRDEYFVRDRDYGTHDSTNTIYYIFDYLKHHDENYSQLDTALVNLLKDEFLSISDLTQVLNIIWCYLSRRYEEGKLSKDWFFSSELIELIQFQISKHRQTESQINQINWFITSFKERFKFMSFE